MELEISNILKEYYSEILTELEKLDIDTGDVDLTIKVNYHYPKGIVASEK